MKNNNIKIRKAMKENGVFLYEVAEMLGISEPTICRKFRKELPNEEQEQIVQLIKERMASNGRV